MRVLKIIGYLLLFGGGFACGAVSFIQTQARPLPALHQCLTSKQCLSNRQVLGLIASVGLHLAPGAMPGIVARSPECVGISSPKPEARVDLVFFPTHDARDLLDVEPQDERYLMGCIALMRQVADRRGISDWRIVSHGPGNEKIAYLHLHLLQD